MTDSRPSARTDSKDRYQPLMVNGRRDSARRFIDTRDGSIISRREHIIRTEGRTPEQKAYDRYVAGEAPAGKTVRRIIRKREAGRPVTETAPRTSYPGDLETRRMRPNEPERGFYQLTGRYRFRHEVTGVVRDATGFSYATRFRHGRTTQSYEALHAQAIENAVASIEGPYGWLYEETVWEHWLQW